MRATPGQTIGPFFGYALPSDGGPDLVAADHPDAVRLRGRVLDGAGVAVPDALLELTHVDPSGFSGWGRAATDVDGGYAFTTARPTGSFLGLTVFARGLLDRLFTRVYLPGCDDDALLAGLPPERRTTLVARGESGALVFDVHLQGDRETVFLTYPRH